MLRFIKQSEMFIFFRTFFVSCGTGALIFSAGNYYHNFKIHITISVFLILYEIFYAVYRNVLVNDFAKDLYNKASENKQSFVDEIKKFYAKKGLEGKALNNIVDTISLNKNILFKESADIQEFFHLKEEVSYLVVSFLSVLGGFLGLCLFYGLLGLLPVYFAGHASICFSILIFYAASVYMSKHVNIVPIVYLLIWSIILIVI